MDPVHFSAEEVLNMAIRIEENGEKFYTDAAKTASEDKLKELFIFLATEEKKHTAYFRKLKDMTIKESVDEVFTDDFNDASLYIKAYADTKIFTEPEEGQALPAEVKTEEEALNYAIIMEKESLLFYYELLRAVREKDRDVLNEIINEEKAHLMKLSEAKVRLYG